MVIGLIDYSVDIAEEQRSALKPNCTAKTGAETGLDRAVHHCCGEQN